MADDAQAHAQLVAEMSEFLGELLSWSERVGSAYLDGEGLERLSPAITELREIQLSAVRLQLEGLSPEDFAEAGMTPQQARFKIAVASEAMRSAETPPTRVASRDGWQPDAEVVGSVVDVVKEILGSLKGLSKWVEAISELVGVVGAGVGSADAVRRHRNRFRRRRDR